MKSILLLTFLAAAITICTAIPAVKVERKDSIDIKTAEVQKTTSTNAGQKTSGDAKIATTPATKVKTSSSKGPEAAEKLPNGVRTEIAQASKGQDTTEKDSNKPFQGDLERKQTTDVHNTVVVSQATKQTQAAKSVSQTAEQKINDDLNKRSGSGSKLKSPSEKTTVSAGAQQIGKTQDTQSSTAGKPVSVETKKTVQSSGKEISTSDDLNGRSEVAKSTSQGKTISVENETKKASAGQVSVGKESTVEIHEAPQTSGTDSDRSEVRTTSKRTSSVKNVAVKRPVSTYAVSSQSSEENQSSDESSEDRPNSRKPQSGERNGREQAGQVSGGQSSERSGGRGRSNERSGKRSKQSSGGRRY